LSRHYQRSYTTVAADGRRADPIAARLFHEVVKPTVADLPRLTLTLDDTPP
jgi:hypothetical protein